MKHATMLLGCLLLIASSALPGMSQWNTLTGARVPQLVAAPLKITTPTINARTAKSWTSRPLVQVENVSNKPIEYLTIEVTLPGVTDPFMLAYGQQPGKPVDTSLHALQPGAKVNLNVAQHACELMQKRLREMDARSLAGNHANTKINGVVFNDETAWFYGLPHVMEPNNPLQWNVAGDNSTAAARSDAFSFLKVGLRETSNIICWTIVGTGFVDCCGIQQASVGMVKGSGEWSPERHVEECCTWTVPVECTPL